MSLQHNDLANEFSSRIGGLPPRSATRNVHHERRIAGGVYWLPVLRFGAGHWKLILRKPYDRAPAYTSMASSQPSASRSLQDCSDRASHTCSAASLNERRQACMEPSQLLFDIVDVGLGPTRSTAEPLGADFGRSGENFAESHGWRVRG
jgi:hypothetical protein